MMLHIRKPVLLALILLVFSVPFVAAQDGSLVDVATAEGNFTTLLTAAETAGLTATLSDSGEYTLFAPTDEAFAALPADITNYLMAHPDTLARVLSYHVAEGTILSTDVTGETAVATLNGDGELTVGTNEMGVTVNGAHVVTADLAASNGVIHAIDTVLIPAFELPAVDPLAVSDNIVTAGSSTVFPLSERMADLFNQEGFAGTITVDSVGTGAGFERFCVAAETDISNASRPIKQDEIDTCAGNGRDPLGFYVAIDALTVAVSAENTFADNLTLEQLAAVFSGEAATWADVNPDWPAEPIQLFSPGTDSGTFDFFVEVVYDTDEEPILNAPGIQLSEDDNVLVQGVLGSQYAIGYFGYAYYQENQDVLRAVSIEGVAPTAEAAESGEYPLSRPLFIYTTASIMQEKPQVAAFVNYFITNVDSQLGTAEGQIGYFPVSANVANLNRLLWLAANEVM